MHSDSQSFTWTRRRFLGAGLLAAGALLVPSHLVRVAESSAAARRYRDLWAMGGWNHLLIEADSDDAACTAMDAAVAAIREVDREFSVFDVRSPLSRLNASDATNIPIDDSSLLESIHKSLSLANSVSGAFDPTVESLMRRWGFRDSVSAFAQGECPLVRDWDYRMIRCDLLNSRIYRESPAISIDSGGWAKGLAAERASRAAFASGATMAHISCGGDIYRQNAVGEPEWECSIRNPLGRRGDVALCVRHRFHTVATSGNCETYRVTPNGDRIGHLMDPRTGKPAASDLLSVSVFGHDGLSVDAISSALFVMGRSEALTWLRRHPDLGAVLIDKQWRDNAQGLTVVGDLQVIS